MSNAPHSILIADDHPLFRSALQQVLGPLFAEATLHQAANVAELQSQVEQHPDLNLLLLDLHMPGALGFSALSWFVGHKPATPVIMISANAHPETVRRAIDHGAAGFLSKSADINDMQDCIQRVIAGERGLHPGLDSRADGASLQSLDVAEALASLTIQQFRVASMLVEGLLNKQIAYALDVKEATIKAHMTEIFRKLGVHSRTQAVLALSSLQVELPQDLNEPPSA
ncbi:DNA-binding response regulator [Halioglobus japonicus]|uniref:DNA-binding response regulator n=1 Tax=Halioglobus japonicus TaxID=930805 RepID=A0AAP8MGT0_9GAMM|nr:response regulator transcription factor [Halioglobus japonicus]AQA19535.1 DNA-binding response regulator [Halioglobus japonicus]PLW87399.1 DNA-binding response regulator [Halioglobus japonicus]GHD08692.1 DNA-binding response regulator [Halioglobus japonicus]